jgi:hypothetical protein
LPVFGYVVVNAAKTAVLYAEKFATPFNFNRSGQPLQFVPSVRLDT